MRIIDKNTDFYDYLQNVYRDSSVTFDRTDSFVVTKEILCKHLPRTRIAPRWVRDYSRPSDFVLLQVCNTFWLFLVDAFDDDELGHPLDYKIELLSTWKNYEKQRRLISLDVIEFDWYTMTHLNNTGKLSWTVSRETIVNNAKALTEAVNSNNYEIEKPINHHTVYYGNGQREEKHIPILKASGMAAFIDPLDVYMSIEEFFSLEKQASERTESVGITDVEKVENHGFDKKISFRGK